MSNICNIPVIQKFTQAEHDKHIDGICKNTITAQYLAKPNILFLAYCVNKTGHSHFIIVTSQAKIQGHTLAHP